MRALVCESYREFEELEIKDFPEPELRPGFVRVGVAAASLSFATTLVVAGKYQRKPSLPYIPSSEVAGTVLEVGAGVTRVAPGDRVVAVVDSGGASEQAVMDEVAVHKLPDGLPFPEATNMSISYPTAYGALVWRGKMKPGDTVLVHGATGGTGLAAVQIAKQLGGRVIACVGGPEKAAVASAQGADAVIDHRTEDLRGCVSELTEGRGVDLVYDVVGGQVHHDSLRCLAEDGRIIVIGFAGGDIPQIPANILLLKNIGVLGFVYSEYIGWGVVDRRREYGPRVAEMMDTLLAMWAAGKLAPQVHAVYDLAQFREAMAEIRERRAIGKVVLTP